MLIVASHPLIRVRINHLRDEKTSRSDFSNHIRAITNLMAYDLLADLHVEKTLEQLHTPTGIDLAKISVRDNVLLIPILRAGLGMLPAMEAILPEAQIGFLAMGRNEETLQPTTFYENIPHLDNPLVLLLDPMLATGGSLISAIERLHQLGYKRIKIASIIAAPEGVSRIEKLYPDIQIHVGSLDEKLNSVGYILPGLGDAGDRIFVK